MNIFILILATFVCFVNGESDITENGVGVAEDIESRTDDQKTGPTTETTEDREAVNPMKDFSKMSSFEQYKHLFSEHRARQLEAVKSIVTFGNDKQRYELVNVMLKQLFTSIQGAKQNLTLSGFMPGDPFPENETVRDYMSKVLENTAMFGDMVLRLPDTVHDLYDRQKDWQLTLAWGYGFCTQSQAFDGPNEQLLNLMAQEVGIIPTDPTYVNPFKASNKKKKFEEPKPAKKKEKKKIRRGPRLSHSEL